MNKKIFIFVFALAFFAVSSFVSAATPDGSGPWADEVVSFSQGLRENGTAVASDRSVEANALGEAEGTDSINFVALGYGGELVVKFENSIYNGDGNDLRVVETTYNNDDCESYPERVQVDVSADGNTWYSAGEPGCQDFELDLADIQLECIQYVKMTDVTDSSEFNVNHITDGYDVDGVKALNSREGDCVIAPECTLTQGYWKNHSIYGPAPYDETWNNLEDEDFYLSGQSYYEILHTPAKGNAYYNLAHQFIATELNGFTTEIYDVWNDAKALFEKYSPEYLEKPKGKKDSFDKELRAQFVDLAGQLADYNEGLTGPGHCSDN